MKIELFGDHERSSVIEFDCNTEELSITGDLLSPDSVIHIICKVKRDEDLVRVEVQVVSSAVLECSRCLESFGHDIFGGFSLVIRRMKKGEVITRNSGDDEDEDRDGLIFLSHDEDSIDITEFVHDALLLSIPVKSLCDENCKGLCPVCGNNLNESDCGCNKASSDPRWQGLNNYFGDSAENKKVK